MRDQESREAAPSIDEATVDASMGDEPEGWSGRPAGRSRNDRLRAFRPREKLISHGAAVLAHAELLEVVLGGAPRREPAHRIAERLLRRHGLSGLAGLLWIAGCS